MNCPKCNACDWKVVDKRDTENLIRRRRQCKNCGARITTYEAEASELIEPKSEHLKRIRRNILKSFIENIKVSELNL